MPRGYRRNWFAIEASIIDHPKWMALSWADRGKWLAVRALAERQPTGEFKDAGHLATLLAKEGDSTPVETIRRLAAVHLLDVSDGDGSISIHGMAEYLPGLSTDRVNDHRNGPKRTETGSPATDSTDRHNITRAPATRESGPAREERGEGETLKQYLGRLGMPIPEVATKEATNGTIKPQGGGDDHGKGGRRTRRRTEATG